MPHHTQDEIKRDHSLSHLGDIHVTCTNVLVIPWVPADSRVGLALPINHVFLVPTKRGEHGPKKIIVCSDLRYFVEDLRPYYAVLSSCLGADSCVFFSELSAGP